MSRRKKRMSHLAHGKRYKGRQASEDRQHREVLAKGRIAQEEEERQSALTDAEREVRKIQKESRLSTSTSTSTSREAREADELDYQRRLALARKLVAERALKLAEVRREMTGVPVPREYYGRSTMPGDLPAGVTEYVPQARSWRSEKPGTPALRKLNGLD